MAKAFAATLCACACSTVLAVGDNSAPTALNVDAAGRILISGAAQAGDGRSAAVVLRFLPSGQLDPAWGERGRGMAPAPRGDASAADTLPLADGSTLVLGTIDDAQKKRAALWRLRSDGVLDTAFAATGLLVASGLRDSRGLSIQQSADGMVHIGVQSGSGDKTWLEVHRWKAGAEAPLRVASQEFPTNWVGPAVLTRRDTTWVWADGSQPQVPPLELVAVSRDSPWTSVAVLPLVRPSEAASTAGHAVLNPFGEGAHGGTGMWGPTLDDLASPGMLVAALLAALCGTVWWWRRS